VLISVIVPLYHGKKYISGILKILERNLLHASVKFDIELILVNDSPEETIRKDELEICTIITPKLIVNKKNMGIHYSRVQGLKEAAGEYILFLDQDDQIADHYFESQLKHIGNKDIVVANGIAQYPTYDKMLYRYWIMQCTVKHIYFYVRFDNRIISPGQCLIKRNSIPAIWKDKILTQNGADDYFLWLIMLTQNCRFALNRQRLYTHVYTSVNASANKEEIRQSVEEMLTVAESAIGYRKVKMVQKRLQKSHMEKIYQTFVSTIEGINKRRS